MSRFLAAAIVLLLLPGAVTAVSGDGDAPIDLEALDAERRTLMQEYGLGEKIEKRLRRVTEYMDVEDYERARELLASIGTRRANPYERAMVEQLLGQVAFAMEDHAGAAEHFERAIAQEALPLEREVSLRFNVVQLYAAQEEWEKSLAALDQWFRYVDEPNPTAYYLRGVAYYRLEEYDEALVAAKQAVELSDEPRDAWLELVSALHMMREDYQRAAPVLETLVSYFPKKRYWSQLSLLYGVMEDYKASLAAQQMAYRQGLLTESKELERLAQTYLYEGLPYPAARVLQKGLDDGVLEPSQENLELLANSWIAARDFDRALPPLQRAAEISGDGRIFVRLGQIHIRREEWAEARRQFESALETDGLQDVGSAQLMLGIAIYNETERPASARPWFERAAKQESTRSQADAWLQILDREEESAGESEGNTANAGVTLSGSSTRSG